jgi:hypothetical protein
MNSVQQELGRLRLALQFDIAGSMTRQVRSLLAEKAQAILRRAVEHSLYCEFSTFPLWDRPEDMLDYGMLWQRFPVTDLATVCLTVQPNPIHDEIADSIFDLFPEPLVVQARSDLSTEIAVRVEDMSPLAKAYESFVGGCFSDVALSRGAVLYGDVFCDPRELLVEREAVTRKLLAHIAAHADETLLLLTR